MEAHEKEKNESDAKSNDKKERNEIIKSFSYLSQIGISMAACVFIGVMLGKFLDGLLKTSPWLILVFSILGVLAAFKTLFDIANKKIK